MPDATEPDPQLLLPADFRSAWAVIPRASLNWLVVACLILGAGTALTAAGFMIGHDGMRWGWPVAYAAALLGGRIMSRVERRRLDSLRCRDGNGVGPRSRA